MYTDHQSTDDQCALMICLAPAVPAVSVHQCLVPVPISTTSMPPVSATCQCHMSAAFQCPSVMPVNAHQCPSLQPH
ncbi:unnamed protein product [Staurois parvus]|uniref:Uncharacterized protein n=1 Tax=Staurois parvus TaxID=386267 RepID=A0ABN9HR72_9NEOB|nr:unnamed protein product [Staurois parvus]